MITITSEIKKQFKEILQGKKISSVYQPIVSLENGEVMGYEALSRITCELPLFNTEELFQIAETLNKVWELEEMCRKKSLKHAMGKPAGKKLFLNVDPKVMHDDEFKKGITCKYLQKYGLCPEDIVFEITERSSIEDKETFQKTITHYKNQTYEIAIDDFGAGYAGLNRVCSLSPNFLKIDMAIVRDIDKDSIKKSLVESFVSFCKNAGIRLIAEGIETKEELKTLIRLGVEFGQGYYLQKPCEQLGKLSKEMEDKINYMKKKYTQHNYQPSFWGNVGTISKSKETTTPETPGFAVFEYIKKNPYITEICVVNEHGCVMGMLTRTDLLEIYGGRFGYNLNIKKTSQEIMRQDFLIVDAVVSIESVSKMALARPIHQLYDAVVITQNEKYLGVVTVKDLLEAAITIQVTKATDANPLTGLPGNALIQQEVVANIEGEDPFSIIYIDLDNFKAYNDAYGFNNGDTMIKTVVNCMEQACRCGEFKGHVGGDDFVIISDYCDIEDLCQNIMNLFDHSVKGLYNDLDLQNGYIRSKNRNGFEDTFPIATLSIAAVTNQTRKFENLDEFSKELAVIKKKSKQIQGNSLVKI